MTYFYDAWGNHLSTTGTMSATLGTLNPLRYRGYIYDQETGLYYLQSRYYNPTTGRFINADALAGTGQGELGNNMFAYCGNNPITRSDQYAFFWDEIGDWFESTWENIKRRIKNTFGAGSTSSIILYENEVSIIPSPSPLTITEGTRVIEVVSSSGDSSKFISVYADGVINKAITSSSAGLYINVYDFLLDTCFALDNIGVSGSIINGNNSDSIGIVVDLMQLKAGLEFSTSATSGNITTTNYTNVSINLWSIAALYLLLTTGQWSASPSVPQFA